MTDMNVNADYYYNQHVIMPYVLGALFLLQGCANLFLGHSLGLFFFFSGAISIYTAVRARSVPMLTIEDTHMLWSPSPIRSPLYIDREDFMRVERSDMGWLKGGECLTIHWAQGKFTIPVNSIGAENADDVMERLSSWMPEEYVAW